MGVVAVIYFWRCCGFVKKGGLRGGAYCILEGVLKVG